MTLFRWDVINRLLQQTARRRYLEIGVQRGICGARVRADERWGVDPEYRPAAQRHYTRILRQTSDDFFLQVDPDQRFDVVLVDGLHHAEQVLRDVDNALRHLAADGFIVLHDCNPESELAQRVPRETGVWNGDCWKAMVALRQRPDLQAFTIASDHGVGVLRRGEQEPLRGVPAELTYAALDADRERLLGLFRPERWHERIAPKSGLGRVVVVSANFGDRDIPCAPPAGHDVDEYVMFSDAPAPRGWSLQRLPDAPRDPRAAARLVKTRALELVDADLVVWIDGRIKPTVKPLRPLLSHVLRETDIAGYPHPWRRCAYAEAAECAKLELAPADALAAQVADYRAQGFPEHAGLWNTMVLARKRTDAMIEFGREWSKHLVAHTLRDQVSFPFLLWQRQIVCVRLGPDVYRKSATPFFERGLHRGQRA